MNDFVQGVIKSGQEVGETVAERNETYGDSIELTNRMMAQLTSEELAGLAKSGNFTEVFTILQKLCRFICNPDGDHGDTFLDIAGYSLIARARNI